MAVIAQKAGGGETNSPASTRTLPVVNANACDLLVLSVVALSAVAPTTTVTDSQSNAWSSIRKTDNGAGATLETFMAGDVAGGATTITLSFSRSVGPLAYNCHAFSGVAPAHSLSIVDQSVGDHGTSGNPSAGSVTTAQSDELLYSVAAVLGQVNLTPGEGWWRFAMGGNMKELSFGDTYRDSAAGTYTDGWTGNAGFNWLAQTVAFVETTGATENVSAGQDGGETSGGAWNVPDGFAAGGIPASAACGGSPLPVQTNTLRCKFNAGSFPAVTGSITGVLVSFTASNDNFNSTSCYVSSVKLSSGTLDLADNAQLGASGVEYTYGGPCSDWGGLPDVNGDWEIDLRFSTDDLTNGASPQVSGVTATVYYYTPSSG